MVLQLNCGPDPVQSHGCISAWDGADVTVQGGVFKAQGGSSSSLAAVGEETMMQVSSATLLTGPKACVGLMSVHGGSTIARSCTVLDASAFGQGSQQQCSTSGSICTSNNKSVGKVRASDASSSSGGGNGGGSEGCQCSTCRSMAGQAPTTGAMVRQGLLALVGNCTIMACMS